MKSVALSLVYCSLTISMPRACAAFLNTVATPWP